MKNSAFLIFLWLAPGSNPRVHTDLIPASWFNKKSTFSQVELKRCEHNNVLEGINSEATCPGLNISFPNF